MLKIRFWDLRKDELMEVWEDDIHLDRDTLKSVYQSVYQYYEEGFDAPIKIEFCPSDGSDPHVIKATLTYLIDDLFHARPVNVGFWNMNGSFQCIRKMSLMPY